MNFGPAHPAAHGVFRLIVFINNEIVLNILHTQGLLWRCTEYIVEYRNLVLTTGYYARLDYVSYVSQEIGFNPERNKSTNNIKSLLLRNSIANHLLNIACTIADAGVLGALLWVFELRELLLEEIEYITGSRLHINLSYNASFDNLYLNNINMHDMFSVLLISIINIRISRARLFINFCINYEIVSICATTGWLLYGSGITDTSEFENIPLIIGSIRNDSLTRHIGRIMFMIWWETNSIITYISNTCL